jgi:histidyl-tRNA synthetase
MIEPRTLKGFRDFPPTAMIPREHLIDTTRRVYRSYGFSPIDTPVLEYLDVLRGKGGEESDRLMYSFQDHGGRDVGMRFDLTVPFARFVAQHAAELEFPFKRYHIAKVWRGENTHRGRYREFMQCDFDTIGTESVAADIETVLVIHDLLLAIGISDFEIRVNNRQVLTGLLEKLHLRDRSALVLRALDKLGKIGADQVVEELTATAGASHEQARQIVGLSDVKGTEEEVCRQIDSVTSGSAVGQAGAERLRAVVAGARAAGVPEARLSINVSIARGLDYYTGTIVETFLKSLPGIGSVCSGGRYDDLAGLFTSQRLPGIGASLGLDRLLAAMEELGMLDRTPVAAPVFIPYFDKNRLADYLKLAALIRQHGIGTEFYPEPKKLGQQLKYADRKGFHVAVIAGEREFAERVCQIKNLTTGDSVQVSLEQSSLLIDAIQSAMS